MWFVFPQLRGLDHSSMAEHYGISFLGQARAYLAHPVLGPWLDVCTRAVQESKVASLHAIFGSPDDIKFRSCVTLFAIASGGGGQRISARARPVVRRPPRRANAGSHSWRPRVIDAAQAEL